MFGGNAGFDELVADVQRVRNIDGEANRFPTLAVLVPGAYDVADEVGAVHALGELQLDVITDTGFDTAQVRIDRCEYAHLHQMLLLN